MGCGCAKRKKANQKTRVRNPSSKSRAKGLPIITIKRNKKIVTKKSK